MDNLILFDKQTLNTLLIKQSGETKFGEHVQLLPNVCNIYEQLKTLDVEHVILGIPEAVGVFANNGKSDTSKVWEATIKILLNVKNDDSIDGRKTLILGEIDCKKEQEKLKKLDSNKKNHIKKARKLVDEIDKKVTYVIHDIVKAGKTPIIIGGGQNNAYGIIKGTALAKNTAINAVNFDFQLDFEDDNGRHNKNAFSYVYTEGFLKNYFVLGVNMNSLPDKISKTVDKLKSVQYQSYQNIKVNKNFKFKAAMKQALNHVSKNHFGIELDATVIKDFKKESEPLGFGFKKAKKYVSFFGKQKNAAYLHICEAIVEEDSKTSIDAMIAELIIDFLKAKQ